MIGRNFRLNSAMMRHQIEIFKSPKILRMGPGNSISIDSQSIRSPFVSNDFKIFGRKEITIQSRESNFGPLRTVITDFTDGPRFFYDIPGTSKEIP